MISAFGVVHIEKALSPGQLSGLRRVAHAKGNFDPLRRFYASNRLEANNEGRWSSASRNEYAHIHQRRGSEARVNSKAAEQLSMRPRRRKLP